MPPGPPPCLSSKGADHQSVRSHTRMLGPSVFAYSNTEGLARGAGLQSVRSHTRMLRPSVFPDSNTEGLARQRVFRMFGPIPECLVLQYLQIQESCQNAWSFSISRFTGSQNVWSFSISTFTGRKSSLEISKYIFLGSVAKSDPPDPPIRSVSSSQHRRLPRKLKLITNLGQKQFFL